MTQEELATYTEQIAENTTGPNKQIVHAIANQIKSNARSEDSQERFASSTRKTEIVMIILAVSQSIFAVVSILIAIYK